MKMNKWILPILFVATFLASCSDDDDLTPSNLEKNWFVLEDSDDPVDHLRYLFYEKTGIPVFYNDTIGATERVDAFGNTYIDYATLSIEYALGGVGTSPMIWSYTFCPKEDVPDGLDFLEEDIMPWIPESMHIHSFLFLDELSTSGSTTSFKGMNTVLVAQIPKLKDMEQSERASLKASVLSSIFAASVSAYEDELKPFYQTTRSYYTAEDLYGYNVWYYQNRTGYYDPEEVGFLGVDPTYPSCLPTESIDVSMYVEAIFTYTEAEFEALYGEYEAVMKKYEMMVNILKTIGVPL